MEPHEILIPGDVFLVRTYSQESLGWCPFAFFGEGRTYAEFKAACPTSILGVLKPQRKFKMWLDTTSRRIWRSLNVLPEDEILEPRRVSDYSIFTQIERKVYVPSEPELLQYLLPIADLHTWRGPERFRWNASWNLLGRRIAFGQHPELGWFVLSTPERATALYTLQIGEWFRPAGWHDARDFTIGKAELRALDSWTLDPGDVTD